MTNPAHSKAKQRAYDVMRHFGFVNMDAAHEIVNQIAPLLTPAPQPGLLVRTELRQGRETRQDSIFGRHSFEFVAHMVRDNDRLELHVRARSQAVTGNLAERAIGGLCSHIKRLKFLTFRVVDVVISADQVEEVGGHVEFLCTSSSPDFSQAPKLRTEPDKAPAPQPHFAEENGLTEAERDFLDRLRAGRRLGVADRAEDRLRQKMRRAGLAKVVMNPRRWIITEAGLAALTEPGG